MRFDLAAIARRAGNPRKRQAIIRDIVPTDALASDLARIYLRAINAWAAAIPGIMAQYERAIATHDGLRDSISDVNAALESAGENIGRLVLNLSPSMRTWVLRVESWHRNKWVQNVLSAAGATIETLISENDVDEPLGAVLGRNVALVRNVSDEAQARISDITFRGFTARTPPREVAKQMDEAIGLGRKRSIRIASDQLTKLTATLDGERMRQAGIEEFKYRSSHKQHFRPHHAARDGRIYDLDTFKEIGGDDVIEPGDRPGEPPFCGCRKQGIVIFD